MNKKTAKAIVEHGITWADLQLLLRNVYAAGLADARQAEVNRAISKDKAFNILAPCIMRQSPYEEVRTRGDMNFASSVLREFGAIWDGWRPDPVIKKKRKWEHQEAQWDTAWGPDGRKE